ncbi:MAG: DUF2202 domain-containing protein [Sphingobacteriales bacterium]|jgi:hypothetical protein|nr:DUF2202 domain-containing protein [Sphingobacteriales bacterium]
MKNRISQLMLIAIVFVVVFSGCKKDNSVSKTDIYSQINAYPYEAVSNDEIISLKIMREEEKLAHDVYVGLFNKWNVNAFSNISSSEQIHTTAISTLLKKYNITDPVGTNGVGVFTDTTLQNLYTNLITEGNKSALAALIVGATIEDLDIYDLKNWDAKIDNQDIKFVYQNLNKGSRNHMRSFYNEIIGAGGSYTAQFISQDELNAIVNTPKETGSW